MVAMDVMAREMQERSGEGEDKKRTRVRWSESEFKGARESRWAHQLSPNSTYDAVVS